MMTLSMHTYKFLAYNRAMHSALSFCGHLFSVDKKYTFVWTLCLKKSARTGGWEGDYKIEPWHVISNNVAF